MPYNDGIVTSEAQFRDALVRSLAGGSSGPEPVELRTAAVTAADELAAVAEACRTLDRAAALGGALDDLTRAAARLAGRAALFVVRNGRLQLRRSDGFDSASAGPAASARAFPLIVGGRVVAVLYAESLNDGGESMAAGRRRDLLDVLASHAGRVLESMTLHRALGLTTPRLESRPGSARLQTGAGGSR